MPASTITVAQWVRRTIQWCRRTDGGDEVDAPMNAPVVLMLWGPTAARKGWSPLPGFTPRSPLERSHQLRRDPAAVIEPRLRLNPRVADPAGIDPARVECDVVRDHLIAGIRRAVAPGGVLRSPTPGRHGPVTRHALPFAERRALAGFETAGCDVGGRDVVRGRTRGLAHTQCGSGIRDRQAAKLDADAERYLLEPWGTREVPHRYLPRSGDHDAVRPRTRERAQAGAVHGMRIRVARHGH